MSLSEGQELLILCLLSLPKYEFQFPTLNRPLPLYALPSLFINLHTEFLFSLSLFPRDGNGGFGQQDLFNAPLFFTSSPNPSRPFNSSPHFFLLALLSLPLFFLLFSVHGEALHGEVFPGQLALQGRRRRLSLRRFPTFPLRLRLNPPKRHRPAAPRAQEPPPGAAGEEAASAWVRRNRGTMSAR